MAEERICPVISTFSVTKAGMVAETYAVFAAWDLGASLDENLERACRENRMLAATEKWLREMRRILRARFGEIRRHAPLIRLAQAGLPLPRWRPILLWHICMRELLLSDFVEEWLFPRRMAGLMRVRGADVRTYLAELPGRGLVKEGWSASTIGKMASSLPRYAADLGLLRGRSVKEIVPPALPEEALLYVLHDLAAEVGVGQQLLEDRRWRRLLMTRGELEAELLRLHQLRRLRYEMAGTMVSVELPFKSVEAYVEHLVG